MMLQQFREILENAENIVFFGGTSLTVHPAASLVTLFEGEHFVIINQRPTPYDGYVDLIIRQPIEEVFSVYK